MVSRFLVTTSLAAYLVACAAAPGDDANDTEQLGEGAHGDAGHSTSSGSSTNRDAGHTTTSTASHDAGTSSSSSSSSSSASNPLAGLGSLFGGSSDAGAAKPAGDGGMCENLICFDIFDCAIFHPDALGCGFTACVGFVCVK